MLFLPNDDAAAEKSRSLTEEALKAEGFEVFGWREVPVDNSCVGRFAAAEEPRCAQVVVHDPQDRCAPEHFGCDKALQATSTHTR